MELLPKFIGQIKLGNYELEEFLKTLLEIYYQARDPLDYVI